MLVHREDIYDGTMMADFCANKYSVSKIKRIYQSLAFDLCHGTHKRA